MHLYKETEDFLIKLKNDIQEIVEKFDYADLIHRKTIELQSLLNASVSKYQKGAEILLKNVIDYNINYFLGEIQSHIISKAEGNFIQMQYSDWDCGLACIANFTNGKIKLKDLYIKFYAQAKVKGISTKTLASLIGDDDNLHTASVLRPLEGYNLNRFDKAILLLGDNLKNTRKGAHYVCLKNGLIFDSEDGIFNVSEYNRFKYVLKVIYSKKGLSTSE